MEFDFGFNVDHEGAVENKSPHFGSADVRANGHTERRLVELSHPSTGTAIALPLDFNHAATAPKSIMSEPSPALDLADRFVAALQAIERDGRGAVPAMTALFTDSATLVNSALEQRDMRLQGHEGAEDFWSGYADAFLGASTTFSHLTFSENAIGLFWLTQGVHAADDGPSKSYPGATLLEHDGSGVITSFRGYYDSDALKSKSAPSARE